MQGTSVMAVTKIKQLLNELSCIVMASTANAFIAPLSCVWRQICLSLLAAKLHTQSIGLSTAILLFFPPFDTKGTFSD